MAMAPSAGRLPWIKRVRDALDNIGKRNGTRIMDGVLPLEIPTSANEQVDAWITKHTVICDLLRFATMKTHVEAQYEAAKKRVIKVLDIDKDKLMAGENLSWTFDNVAVALRVQQGREMLDQNALMTVLVTDYKMSMSDAQTAMLKATKRASNALYWTPTLVRD